MMLSRKDLHTFAIDFCDQQIALTVDRHEVRQLQHRRDRPNLPRFYRSLSR